MAPAPTSAVPAVPPGATRGGTRPPVVDHGPRTGNKLALTLDADMTPDMLALLDAGRVGSHATLRLLDRLERDPVPATRASRSPTTRTPISPSRVRPGSVVVLHVTEAKAAMTDAALPHILAGLRACGVSITNAR